MVKSDLLSPQQIAEIRAGGWSVLTTKELQELCDSHEAMREEADRTHFGLFKVTRAAVERHTNTVEHQRREIERLRDTLRQLQWQKVFSCDGAGHIADMCPMCDQIEPNGHAPDCHVGMLLQPGRDEEMQLGGKR